MQKYLYLLFVIAAAFTSCQKSSIENNDLDGIDLAKDTLTMYVGDTYQIDYTIAPVNYDKTSLVWTSADTNIVNVSKSALVTAKSEGTTKVTVTNKLSTLTVTCTIKVIEKPDPLKNGLIAYYTFNNSANDFSGNNHHGTKFNITNTSNRLGKANSAYYFDGISSFITVEDKEDLRLSNTDFTLNIWVKLDAYNSFYSSSIWNKRLTGADNGWSMGVGGNTQFTTGTTLFGPGGGSSNNAFGTKVINVGNWTMVTCLYKLSTRQVSIYVNGVLDNVTNNMLPPNAFINTLLYIGRDNPSVPANGYYLKGSLDDMRMYGRALSVDEIQQLLVRPN